METQYYAFTASLFIALVIFLYFAVFTGLANASKQATEKLFTRRLSIATLLWLLACSLVSLSGLLTDFSGMPPRFAPLLIVPLAVIVYLFFSRTFLSVLTNLSLRKMHFLQSFRIIMEIILWWLYLDTIIPVQMTFEGRNFDLLIGLSAPLVAAFCFSKSGTRKVLAVAWNILGLAMLFNIVIVAILSTPSAFRIFMNDPSNTIIAYWPFVWLPAFVVPVALALHAYALLRLIRD